MSPKIAPDDVRKANQPSTSDAKTERDPNRPDEAEDDSAHMGASESQVVPTTPPTEALGKLLREPSQAEDDAETADDQFTPG